MNVKVKELKLKQKDSYDFEGEIAFEYSNDKLKAEGLTNSIVLSRGLQYRISKVVRDVQFELNGSDTSNSMETLTNCKLEFNEEYLENNTVRSIVVDRIFGKTKIVLNDEQLRNMYDTLGEVLNKINK